MSESIETYRGTVFPWHCDHMGHMNVMWYVGKFDEATWTMFVHLGITPTYQRDSNCGMVAVRQSLEYRQELLAGDALVVRSQVLRVGKTSLRWAHMMENLETGDVAATCEMTGVHFDRTARRPRPLPSEVVVRVQNLLAGQRLAGV